MYKLIPKAISTTGSDVRSTQQWRQSSIVKQNPDWNVQSHLPFIYPSTYHLQAANDQC